MKKLKSIDKEQRLYVFQEGNGFTCLGFDNLKEKTNRLTVELNKPGIAVKRTGTKKALSQYNQLINIAKEKNKRTGWRSSSELTPELIGLEGKRVEVITSWGETQRFYVGKSTGFIPCHLEISRSNSTGGCAVVCAPFKNLRVLY